MEVLGLLSAAGMPTQGLLPSGAGSTAVEFAAVLDGLDLQPADTTESAAEPAQGDEEADESEDTEQAEVDVMIADPTVAATAATPMPTALADASRPKGDSPAPPVKEVDVESAQILPAAPQLALVTPESPGGDSAQTELAPAAVDVAETDAQEQSGDGLRREPTARRASVAITSGLMPSQPAASPEISASSRPETHAAVRESQTADPVIGLDLPDLASFTVTVHESRFASLVPDSHTTTRAQPAPDARHVLQQVARKLTDGAEGVVEIALSPEELGKVRLVIAPGEKPAVTVHADRPETYDLLRRNAEALDKELRSAGIFGADISFSGGNDRPGNRNQPFLAASRSSGSRDHIVSFAEHTTPAKARSAVDRRIDIRI